MWDLEKQEARSPFATDRLAAGRTICFSPDGESLLLAVRSAPGRIDVHRLADGSVTGRHKLPPWPAKRPSGFASHGMGERLANIEHMAYLADGSRLLVRRDFELFVLDGKTFAVIQAMDLGCGARIGVSPDGKWLAAGVQPERGRSTGVELQTWSLESLTKSSSHRMARAGVLSATCSATEPRLLTWGDFAWQTWWMERGEFRPLAQGMHRSESYAPGDGIFAAFAPDGGVFVTASSSSSSVRFWDAQTGRELSGLNHGGPVGVHAIAFSPNGKYLASATHLIGRNWRAPVSDVYLWDLASTKERPSYFPGRKADPSSSKR